MYWTQNEAPEDMRRLPLQIREKAVEIGNQLLAQGYQEMKAVPIAIDQARKWWRNNRPNSPAFGGRQR